jgi:hypothetical protein
MIHRPVQQLKDLLFAGFSNPFRHISRIL